MRLAVISDIHGNVHALEAVLADIAAQAPDLTVNLGDHFSGPFLAGRTADVLGAHDFPSIAGNHDRWLLGDPEHYTSQWERWARPQLSDVHMDWIRALPPTRIVADGAVFMCHATPFDDVTAWLDEFNAEHVRVPRLRSEIEPLAEGVTQKMILCGHTHIARMVSLSDGRLIVNPGSVGAPGFRINDALGWSAGSPHARYAVLDQTAHGWSVSFRAVAYDFEAAAKVAGETGSPELANVLRTGWIGN